MNNLKDKKKTILVIEDENDILISIKEFLESEDYKVLIATNGKEAMDLLSNSTTPNLILLDMKMPIMNGWEFARVFNDKYNHISPIVVLTAAAEAKERANDIKAVGWIEKPFDLDIFLEQIKKYQT